MSLLYSQLKLLFPTVTCAKPKSSRNASIEAFAVCQNFTLPPGFEPSSLRDVLDRMTRERAAADETLGAHHDVHSTFVPFLACGDLSGCVSSSWSVLNDANEARVLMKHTDFRCSDLVHLADLTATRRIRSPNSTPTGRPTCLFRQFSHPLPPLTKRPWSGLEPPLTAEKSRRSHCCSCCGVSAATIAQSCPLGNSGTQTVVWHYCVAWQDQVGARAASAQWRWKPPKPSLQIMPFIAESIRCDDGISHNLMSDRAYETWQWRNVKWNVGWERTRRCGVNAGHLWHAAQTATSPEQRAHSRVWRRSWCCVGCHCGTPRTQVGAQPVAVDVQAVVVAHYLGCAGNVPPGVALVGAL